MTEIKKIGISTSGGDCAGLNAVVSSVVSSAAKYGWEVYGIHNGTDGLTETPLSYELLTEDNFSDSPWPRLAGSYLGSLNKGVKMESQLAVSERFGKGVAALGLDAVVVVGGDGSMNVLKHYCTRAGIKMIGIPKTIDMDVPKTQKTIGFDTAVQQTTAYCDQLLLTARSHHRWFIVQTMGRECGQLALHAGVAIAADAILMPEIKFDIDKLVEHIKQSKRDYGIIMVSEGISIRGHSGKPADMVSRKLTAAGIANRTAFPEHIQRAGDTLASDRILAAGFVDCAFRAIDNKETFVMTTFENNEYKTISLDEFFKSGIPEKDPNIIGAMTSNAYVEPDNPLLRIAADMGIYIGEMKK